MRDATEMVPGLRKVVLDVGLASVDLELCTPTYFAYWGTGVSVVQGLSWEWKGSAWMCIRRPFFSRLPLALALSLALSLALALPQTSKVSYLVVAFLLRNVAHQSSGTVPLLVLEI